MLKDKVWEDKWQIELHQSWRFLLDQEHPKLTTHPPTPTTGTPPPPPVNRWVTDRAKFFHQCLKQMRNYHANYTSTTLKESQPLPKEQRCEQRSARDQPLEAWCVTIKGELYPLPSPDKEPDLVAAPQASISKDIEGQTAVSSANRLPAGWEGWRLQGCSVAGPQPGRRTPVSVLYLQTPGCVPCRSVPQMCLPSHQKPREGGKVMWEAEAEEKLLNFLTI